MNIWLLLGQSIAVTTLQRIVSHQLVLQSEQNSFDFPPSSSSVLVSTFTSLPPTAIILKITLRNLCVWVTYDSILVGGSPPVLHNQGKNQLQHRFYAIEYQDRVPA